MSYSWADMWHNFVNSAAIIVLAVAFIWMALQRRSRVARLESQLEMVRFAAYDLIRTAQEDADDLRDALDAAGIEQPRPRYQERLRRMALTPEQREIESMEKLEEAVRKIDQDWGIGQ